MHQVGPQHLPVLLVEGDPGPDDLPGGVDVIEAVAPVAGGHTGPQVLGQAPVVGGHVVLQQRAGAGLGLRTAAPEEAQRLPRAHLPHTGQEA